MNKMPQNRKIQIGEYKVAFEHFVQGQSVMVNLWIDGTNDWLGEFYVTRDGNYLDGRGKTLTAHQLAEVTCQAWEDAPRS